MPRIDELLSYSTKTFKDDMQVFPSLIGGRKEKYMNEEFVIIKHKELTDNYLNEIICLKQQHWDYSVDSQKKWIRSCLKPDDLHLLIKMDNQNVAYLSINVINMVFDGQAMVGKGLGNVCVDKAFQRQGLGKKIVEKANEIIKANDDTGILLCHTHLIPFYERCGWINISYDNLEIDKRVFSDVMMLFNNDLRHIKYMTLDRYF